MRLIFVFIAPLLFCCLTLILSGVALFNNPSRVSRNYLLELDLSQANFTALYDVQPPRGSPLTINDTSLMGDVIRFGLWGYCSGYRSVNSAGLVNTHSYNGNGCSNQNQRAKPNIEGLLLSSFKAEDGENVTLAITNPSAVNRRSNATFNGEIAGFVLSILTLVVLVGGFALAYFVPKSTPFVYIAILVVSLAMLVCLVIASASAQDLYDDLANRYTNSLTRTVAHRGTTWFGLSWSAFAFSALTFFCMGAGWLVELFLDRRAQKKQAQIDDVNQQYEQPPPLDENGNPITDFHKEADSSAGISADQTMVYGTPPMDADVVIDPATGYPIQTGAPMMASH